MTKTDTKKAAPSPKAKTKKVSKKKAAKKTVTKKTVAKKTAVTKKVAKKVSAKKAAPAIKKKTVISADERRMMVAVHAYYKWQQAGCPTGQDFNHWLEAEQEIESMLK